MEELGAVGHLFACVFLFHLSASMAIPAITDVTIEALCPGRDRCSLAIYLSGANQMVTGLGMLLATPLVGNLSDKYGRKALLTLPMTAAILPLAVLGCGRSRVHVYIYFMIKTISGMFCDGSMHCLSLAYVADKVCRRKRVSVFGALAGVSAAGSVSGTVVARVLRTAYIFQVSASVAAAATVYMRVFLKESDSGASLMYEECTRPLCSSAAVDESSPRLPTLRQFTSLGDMISLLRSSSTLTRAATIAFFNSLADHGYMSALLICCIEFRLRCHKYYLKAQFHFNKDQFADLLLIIGFVGAISQLILMPLVAPSIGEERLLTVGLLASCTHIFLYSIAWSYWVPYLASMFVFLSVFIHPCLRSIVSKKVGPKEQGMAQGCVISIISSGSIISPLVFTPLTALFLSEHAPFAFRGFSIMCAGFISLVACTLSVSLRLNPTVS